MKIDFDGKGIHLKAIDWKEEQVFKLIIQTISDGKAAVIFETYKGEPVYEMTTGGLIYIGDES